MGLTDKARIFPAAVFLLIFSFGAIPFLHAQNAASFGGALLAAELEKLEKAPPAQKHDALARIAKLSQLSGDKEKAAQAWHDAAYTDASKRDDAALLNACRIYIALGEYEKAESGANVMLGSSQDSNILARARLLRAQLDAFKKDDPQPLAPFASDPAYAAQRPEIYYTLWQISGSSSWKSKLMAEYPQSPESRMASGAMAQAPTPQWLLFPGRDSLAASTAAVAVPAPAPAAAASSPAGSPAAGVLQTGLFGREANAQAMAERLKQAGFEPQVSRRQVNGSEYWAVMVPPGANINTTIMQLKDAGFESFPVFE
jgi:cell division septation protein DedD